MGASMVGPKGQRLSERAEQIVFGSCSVRDRAERSVRKERHGRG